jgi:hypothetical protein
MTRPARLQGLISLGVALLTLCGTAAAVPFQPVLDEFWILKDTNQIFRDSFNGGGLPPSGPDGATTYFVFGAGGMTSEAAGRLTLTPSLGAPTVVTTTFADVATDAVRLLSTNTNNPTNEANFLGAASSFAIHGLYDMSSLPTITGQSFGIRASDRATGIGNEGDNTFALNVGMSNITGEITVFLRHLNFVEPNNPLENAILASVSIQSLLAGADQIELILSKDTNSNLLSPSYILYDNDSTSPIVSQGPVGAGPFTLYNNEEYIRAQFSTTDRVPVPEPTTVALLALGLIALGFRSRKQA